MTVFAVYVPFGTMSMLCAFTMILVFGFASCLVTTSPNWGHRKPRWGACPALVSRDSPASRRQDPCWNRDAPANGNFKVHGRAPKARLIIVDYATILRSSGVVAVVLLSVAQADSSRGITRRLNEITVRVAKETGKELIRANSGQGAIKIENNNRPRA